MVDLYLIRAIIAVFILSINASIAGSFTIFKDVPFLIVGAAHAALAGAALFIALAVYGVFNFDPIIGSIIFAIFVAISAAHAKSKVNIAIGISFAMSMSLAVLFISLIREQASRVWGLLFGDLLLLTNRDIISMAIITIFVIIIALYFNKEFLFISFDSEGAKASGIKVNELNYLLLSLIAVSTVIMVKGVGAILVYAMLVAPAAAANEKAKSVLQVFSISALIALISGFSGLFITFYFTISATAVASLIATLFYFFFVINKKII